MTKTYDHSNSPDWLDDYHPQDECGILAIYAPQENVAKMAFFGLFALQHRGQEAAGIAVADGTTISLHKDVGLVAQVFKPHHLEPMQGFAAIGHTRYSTTGLPLARNAQPFMIQTQYGPIAVAHNGNLVNAADLRSELLSSGIGLSSTSDTEVITMMLARSQGKDWFERLRNVMVRLEGAFSLVVLTHNQVFVLRDPWGFRPLSIGMLPGGNHAAASETGALRTLGCVAIREVQPGEIITLSNNALNVYQALPAKNPLARCVFEHIYFSRPDSVWDELSVHAVRQNLGKMLAEEAPVEADMVIPVPDSSIPAAIGYSLESGIPYNDGFIKNRYIGRTFIEPTDFLRKQGVAMKFNVIIENVRDKRVCVIDDSIVRGNTTGPLLKLLRDAGAKEVHVRITCPPIKFPCYMGVDMGNFDSLLAHRMDVDGIRKHVGADSLHFLSLEKMMEAVGRKTGYCQACFTGNYPIPIEPNMTKTGFELGHF